LVLVVDDDAAMLRSVVRLLGQLGYDTLPFSSAEAFAGHVDFERAVCVLLDINLGDVSSIELRLRLKAAGNSVPVIYMTALPSGWLHINPDASPISQSRSPLGR
jgi:FixJ family two-component response regulator